MSKDLHRLLELSGVRTKNHIVSNLYENYFIEAEIDGQGPLPGLEGPFRMKNGRVVYYDPKEGAYYDRRSDMYLSDEETSALQESAPYKAGVVLHAKKGGEKISLRLEGMMSIRPTVTMLRNNGYEDFAYSDGDEEPVSVDNVDDVEIEEETLEDKLNKVKDDVDHLLVMCQDGNIPEDVEGQLASALDTIATIHTDLMGDEETGDEYDDVDNADNGELDIRLERELTKAEKEKLEKLKKKYDDSGMKANMKKQYGDDWEDVYYGKLTQMAKEGFETFEQLEEAKRGRTRDTKATPSLSRSQEKRDKKALQSRERQQGRKETKMQEGEVRDVVDWSDVKDAAVKVVKKVHGNVDMKKVDGVITNAKKHKPDSTAAAVELVQDMLQHKGEKKEGVKESVINATYFDNSAMPADSVDDLEQKAERTGQADRTGTKNVVPKEVMKAIDKRISELKQSIERYDSKGYNEKSVKVNAVDSLQQIKKNLARGDYEGYMEAQIFFSTLMSPIWDMIPGQVVNYLAKGYDPETEV